MSAVGPADCVRGAETASRSGVLEFMDSFELNKIIGALLGTVFIVFTVSIVSDAIFEDHPPEKPGFIIEAAEAREGDGGGEPEGPAPIGPMLASADAGKGQSVFKKCAACHTVDNDGANKVGPNLWDIVNRPVAGHGGFSYSAAIKEFADGGSVVWDYEKLSRFLLAPRKYVKGTSMGFAGLKKEGDRANVIAYLRTHSDNPAPLPEAGSDDSAASE